MSWPVTANPERFDEAMEWFESRVPILKKDLDKLTKAQRKQAFTIAGVNQLSVIQTVLDGLDRAVRDGQSIDVFRKEMKAELKGWTKAQNHKLRVIFVTNTQLAYNAGRHKQLTDPDVMATRPFWVFDAVLDHRTSAICNSLNGLTLPADDGAWAGNHPPMHHLCRSGIRSLSKRAGEKRGVTTDIPTPKVPKGFGKLPSAPPFKPKKADYNSEAWSSYQRKQQELRS